MHHALTICSEIKGEYALSQGASPYDRSACSIAKKHASLRASQ